MNKYVHVSHNHYMEASGHDSKITASKNAEYISSVSLCHKEKEVGSSISKLSKGFIPPDTLLSCSLYLSPFCQLLEKPDSVTTWFFAMCFTLFQANNAFPRKLGMFQGELHVIWFNSFKQYLVQAPTLELSL